MVLEKTLESALDCKEIQPVHPKGNQSWIFSGRTDVEAETPILWPPDAQNWLIRKDPDAGKDWRQEEKGTTENERLMASPTLWTWIWASSGSRWWTQKPGVLQSIGSQWVGHDWVTELTVVEKKLTISNCAKYLASGNKNYTLVRKNILKIVNGNKNLKKLILWW